MSMTCVCFAKPSSLGGIESFLNQKTAFLSPSEPFLTRKSTRGSYVHTTELYITVKRLNYWALCTRGTQRLSLIFRGEKSQIPKKVRTSKIPKMVLTLFSMLEILTRYCKRLLSKVLK
jgi:hypothetical protein